MEQTVQEVGDVGGRNASHAADLGALAERDGLALDVVEIYTSDEDSVERGVAEVVEKAGRIDVLVNNVGQGSWGLAEAYTTEQQKDLFETNFFSAYRMNRAVAPHMREQSSGLIVQISSLIGRLVLPFMVTYSTARHAVEALAEGYHYELAPFGVDSVIVEPQSHPTQGSLHKIVKSADAGRLAAYGDLARRADAMFEDNDRMLTTEGAPDPRDVADAVARLVATPAGQRPPTHDGGWPYDTARSTHQPVHQPGTGPTPPVHGVGRPLRRVRRELGEATVVCAVAEDERPSLHGRFSRPGPRSESLRRDSRCRMQQVGTKRLPPKPQERPRQRGPRSILSFRLSSR